jgi:thioredoxin
LLARILLISVDKNAFIDQLNQSELPTIVDFWAPWCIPCRRTKPVLEKLGHEYRGRVRFEAINADEHKDLLNELGIMGIPTLLILDGNQQMSRITGARSADNYRRLFETLATGQEPAKMTPSMLDRFMRLGAGATLALFAWNFSIWWLLPIGLVVMFTGVYDCCPIWQAITARLKRSKENNY